jgi:hypothetical protein
MPLNALAPDQRAVVQLVLTRDRSYAQIAELLKISEDAVRARAHKGLSALAPDVELPADKLAQLSDFLLGQQNGKPREETHELLRSSDGAREWAEAVRAELAEVKGASLPELPGTEDAADEPEPEPVATAAEPGEAPAPRPRPLRDKPRTPAAAGPAAPGPSAVAAASSRLGGALLIGLAIVAIVVVVLVLFVFKDDDKSPSRASATPTPTAAATPAPVGEIQLRATKGASGSGVMRLYTAEQQLAFTLEGTGVPPNKANEAYAVWFTSPGGAAQRLGFAQPVGENGQLGTTGPRTEDLDKFPRWLATFKQVVVSRETDGKAKKPGPVVLVGTLPSA